MKRVKIVIVAAISITLLVSAPLLLHHYYKDGWPWHYWGWQTVYVQNVGHFKVPGDWVVTQTDNAVYMTDRPMTEQNYFVYLAGGMSDELDNSVHITKDICYDEIHYDGFVFNECFFGGACYSLDRYIYSGQTFEKYSLRFDPYLLPPGAISDLHLFAWEDKVDQNTLIKIAKSYESESV